MIYQICHVRIVRQLGVINYLKLVAIIPSKHGGTFQLRFISRRIPVIAIVSVNDHFTAIFHSGQYFFLSAPAQSETLRRRYT